MHKRRDQGSLLSLAYIESKGVKKVSNQWQERIIGWLNYKDVGIVIIVIYLWPKCKGVEMANYYIMKRINWKANYKGAELELRKYSQFSSGKRWNNQEAWFVEAMPLSQ